ncbi:MAG: nucleoside deaminase [bacterium]
MRYNFVYEYEKFMYEALKEAYKAYEKNEVPIGAVVVQENKIIGRGYNQVENLQDSTAHAEMIAITSAASYLKNWRLNNTILYTTVEPCLMCLGALFLSRIPILVYGTNNEKKGTYEVDYHIKSASLKIIKGILKEDSQKLLKQFFLKQRKKEK